MHFISVLLTAICLLKDLVSANVEKTIFIAPERQSVPDASIDNLLLVPLNPQHATARTALNAAFPTTDSPQGIDTWMLLEGLSPGSRYELRVCWLATQPTAFRVSTFTIAETFENPARLSSLTLFSNARRDQPDHSLIQTIKSRKYQAVLADEAGSPSLLFLRISAAADYFSLNKTLMEQVPPVCTDVILDEYVFNILPKSLAPTAGYIAVLAFGSWFLSTFLWSIIRNLVQSNVASAVGMKKLD